MIAIRGSSLAIQELKRIESLIRSDLWNRYVAKAQRNALVWWQQRTVPPGVKARFSVAGVSYYGFGRRYRKPYSLPPYYKNSGALERAILARKPKTSRASGQVVSRLAFGGGTLNFMTTTSKPNMRGVVGWVRNTRTITERFTVPAYTRPWRNGSSTVVKVSAYSMTRQRTVGLTKPIRGGDTYAASFGRFTRDMPVIEARVAIELRRIVNRAAYTKGGDVRASLLRPLQESAA
jgi:hypothetical protein